MSLGSSQGKGLGNGRAKGVGKGAYYFEETSYEFSIQSKRDFNKEVQLRSYNNRRQDWSKCMYGEDCLVQMFVEGD
jgi:hypothetical protein